MLIGNSYIQEINLAYGYFAKKTDYAVLLIVCFAQIC